MSASQSVIHVADGGMYFCHHVVYLVRGPELEYHGMTFLLRGPAGSFVQDAILEENGGLRVVLLSYVS